MTEEEYLYERINRLRLDYEKAIKPFVDRLAYLESIKAPKPIVMTREELRAAGWPFPVGNPFE